MKWGVVFFLLFLIPLVSAQINIGIDNPSTPKVIIENPNPILTVSGGSVNFSTAEHNNLSGLQGGQTGQYYHMNQSSYNFFLANAWDWLTQTITDTLYSPIKWNYNQTLAGNSMFLNLSGTNANQNINIGGNNLTLGENLTMGGSYPTLFLGNGNISFWNIAGQTFHISNGVYIDGSVNPFLDIGGLLIVGTYARIAQSLTVGTSLNVSQDINAGRNVTASGFNATGDVFIKDKDVYRWLYNQTSAISFPNIFNQWLNTTNSVIFNNITTNQNIILNNSKSKITDNNNSISIYFEEGAMVLEG